MPPGQMPDVPIYRHDVERAWEEWLQLSEGPRAVPPGELPELWSPLPPGWWFTRKGKPVRICLAIGQGQGTCGYRLRLLALNQERTWVAGEYRSLWAKPSHRGHPLADVHTLGSHRYVRRLGEYVSRRKMVPFDPVLRHGMPDRPPDDAWIGATYGSTGWYLKVYRRWGNKRPFAEPLLDRVPSRDLARLAYEASQLYGVPIRIKGIPTGESILYGGHPVTRTVAPVTMGAWRVD